MSLPRAIFFDWDGTLADSFDFLQSAHDHILEVLGLPMRPKGWFHFYFGKPRDFIYSDVYGDQTMAAQTAFEAFIERCHTQLVKPLAGAQEVLETLAHAGIVMGVVTNKRGDFVRAEVESFGWSNYFACVVGAGEAEEDKPSAAPLAKAVSLAGMEGKPIWYVGDTEADLLCAKNYGCPVLFIDHEKKRPEWLGQYDILYIVNNCGDLKEFFLQNT